VIERPRVFALNLHANYACRHSGACCTAGWAIPVEADRQALLGGEMLLPDAHGACVFFDRTSRQCAVHREHGENRLPDSCFHFPRRALIDDRGVFVTLSHFCPTAAALVVRATQAPAIVEGPPAFPADRRYEGLDARGAWPPLVKADVLFDPPSYTRWESFVISRLGDARVSTAAALAHLAEAAESLRTWTPSDGPLEAAVGALALRPEPAPQAAIPERYRWLATADAYDQILDFVPEGLERPSLMLADRLRVSAWRWADKHGAAKRYLAAKAFGSWAAYEAHGVRTLVAELVLAELVLRVEAIRATSSRRAPLDDEIMIESIRSADWLLVHLVDRAKLMAWLRDVEG
jgi:hypothetical protein